MKCPVCNADNEAGAVRCTACGMRLPKLSPFDPEYVRPAKKKKTWLWILLSITALCAVITGVFAAFLISFISTHSETIIEAPAESRPAPEAPIESIPADVSSEDCFVLAEGALRFLPQQHDGSPIVRIPETVDGQTITAIGADAFAGCTDLTTIILPDTVTAIHPRAFAGCESLRGLFLPEGCSFIGAHAFDGCENLEAIHIPSTMDSIAPGVFDDCASLSFVFVSNDHDAWNELYTDYITPYTYIICLDGDFLQGIVE